MKKVYYYPHLVSEESDAPCHLASKSSNRPKPKMPNFISCALKLLYYITSLDKQKSFKRIGYSSNVLCTQACIRHQFLSPSLQTCLLLVVSFFPTLSTPISNTLTSHYLILGILLYSSHLLTPSGIFFFFFYVT